MISINKLSDENYADLIIENVNLEYFPYPTQITEISYKYSVVNIPAYLLDKCGIGNYRYSIFPKCYTLQSINALEDTGVSMIQSNPNLNLNGNGTLVGIIDTGIDYQNDSFRYTDGSTRIISIWDQTINDDNTASPLGLFYGAEYKRDDINKALRSDNPLDIVPSVDVNGHGTALAGIIGGSPNTQNDFQGVVTQTEFIIVKLKKAKEITLNMFNIQSDKECYQETDLLFALKYVSEYAIVLKKPIAICIAVGTNQGSHTGLDILSSYISQLSRITGFGVCIAAGNEADARRHYNGICYANNMYTDFNLVVSPKDKMFFMELWQIASQRLAIEVISPTGESTQVINPSMNNCYQHNFIFENTTIWINNFATESTTGSQLILVRFENPMEGIWNFRLYNIDNNDTSFNVWLPTGNIISPDTFFLNPTAEMTITSPGNSNYAMTFGAYNPENGAIYISSGRGYTNLNIIKPDMVSPGINILAPTLNNQFELFTGTSVAAAFATGIVAMILEWAVVKDNWSEINGVEIRNMLIRGAIKDNNIIYPNNIWGYGKINIYGLFEKLRI